MMKVAILYICTGKYSVLWDGFFLSSEKMFLTDCNKEYFIFTDRIEMPYMENYRVHVLKQKAEEWPYSSLRRFASFLRLEEQLENFDYIYFFNANAEIVQPITSKMIFPNKQNGEEVVVVQHPFYYDKPVYQHPYSRNIRSNAFVPYSKGKYYVQGSLIGGTRKAFLEMCRELNQWVESDLQKGVIPVVHDESYLNRYIIDHPRFKLLSPEYAHLPKYQWSRDYFEPIVLLRDKNDYFDVDTFKKDNKVTPNGLLSRLYIKIAYKISDRKHQKLQRKTLRN